MRETKTTIAMSREIRIVIMMYKRETTGLVRDLLGDELSRIGG